MFDGISLLIFIKIPVLILEFLYVLFSFVMFNKVRSLGDMIVISSLNISAVITFIVLIHMVAAISLFALSLVIL